MSYERLKEKFDAGEYYDYTLLVRTMLSKLRIRKKETEFKKLIKDSLENLHSKNQVSLYSKLLYITFCSRKSLLSIVWRPTSLNMSKRAKPTQPSTIT